MTNFIGLINAIHILTDVFILLLDITLHKANSSQIVN